MVSGDHVGKNVYLALPVWVPCLETYKHSVGLSSQVTRWKQVYGIPGPSKVHKQVLFPCSEVRTENLPVPVKPSHDRLRDRKQVAPSCCGCKMVVFCSTRQSRKVNRSEESPIWDEESSKSPHPHTLQPPPPTSTLASKHCTPAHLLPPPLTKCGSPVHSVRSPADAQRPRPPGRAGRPRSILGPWALKVESNHLLHSRKSRRNGTETAHFRFSSASRLRGRFCWHMCCWMA